MLVHRQDETTPSAQWNLLLSEALTQHARSVNAGPVFQFCVAAMPKSC